MRTPLGLLPVILGPFALGLFALPGAALAGDPDFTPFGTQPPVSLDVLEPTDCVGCHGDYDVNSVYEPHQTWSGSMMANASRDPIFWAALDVANEDVPGIGDFCLRCHVPKGWLEGRSEPVETCADGSCMEGFLNSTAGDATTGENDFNGVQCHVCHRAMVNDDPPMGEQEFYTQNGQLWIDDEECPDGPASGPCRRGPYDYPPGGDVPPPHKWAHSPLHTESRFCGACHNVTNPIKNLIDAAGADTGRLYPVERTYDEWEASDFGDPLDEDFTTCQDCHMPQATASPAYASAFQLTDRTGNLATHEFVGGNAWIPQVLKAEYGDASQLNREAAYDWTTARTLDMLQQRSAEIEVTVDELPEAGELAAMVRVTNLSGHKLPTGYTEGRRMWLHVEARDEHGQPFWESGAYDTGTAELDHDAQLRIYHSERGIWNAGEGECEVTDAMGDHMFHFVLNDCILNDTRIPPQGFEPQGDVELVPVDADYGDVNGVLQHWDDAPYAIPVPGNVAGPVEVVATLYYQTISADYVDFLQRKSDDGSYPDDVTPGSGAQVGESRADYLTRLWDTYGKAAPVEMVSDSGESGTLGIFADGFESGDTSAW